MYIKDATPATREQIKEKLVPILQERKIKHYNDWELQMLIDTLYGLNLALVNGWSVWAECIREPRGNLDSGGHYYDVYYVTEDRYRDRVWPYCTEFAKKLLNMTEWNRDGSTPKWSFSSGAIGMSRKLDATNGLFCLLRSLTGTYAQL